MVFSGFIFSSYFQELDRNVFLDTYLNILKAESLKSSFKVISFLNFTQYVKLLDMLAFFLQSEVIPSNFGLTNERRMEIIEAVKYLLVSSLPLDPQTIASSSTKLVECTTLLKSVSLCQEKRVKENADITSKVAKLKSFFLLTYRSSLFSSPRVVLKPSGC